MGKPKKKGSGNGRPAVMTDRVVFTCTPAERKLFRSEAKANGRTESSEARIRCFRKDGAK